VQAWHRARDEETIRAWKARDSAWRWWLYTRTEYTQAAEEEMFANAERARERRAHLFEMEQDADTVFELYGLRLA
jgi:hypothetical protein